MQMSEEQLFSGVQDIYRTMGHLIRVPDERKVRALIKAGTVVFKFTMATRRIVNKIVTVLLFPFQFVAVLVLVPTFYLMLRKKPDKPSNDASQINQ